MANATAIANSIAALIPVIQEDLPVFEDALLEATNTIVAAIQKFKGQQQPSQPVTVPTAATGPALASVASEGTAWLGNV